jgi:hypothetical protein
MMIVRSVCLAVMVLTLWGATYTTAWAQGDEPTPLPAHCRGAGPLPAPLESPLDEAFCGCTWGMVYYRGRAVADAPVTLEFNNRQLPSTTQMQPDIGLDPFYVTTAVDLGARRGDLMTMSVTLADQQLHHPFRALPETTGESKGEQQLPLVLPEAGEWRSWFTGGYSQTLVAQGQSIWAGGPDGLLHVDLTTNQQTVHPLPWPTQAVTALAVAPDNSLWAAGSRQLAHYDGVQWRNFALPFSATVRALAVQPTTSDLWVGGGDSSGALARYSANQWQLISGVREPITTVTFDHAGDLWAGTWGGGAYRQPVATLPQGNWLQYGVSNGLASDYIYATVATTGTVWFGGKPYLSEAGVHGGISRYTVATDQWQSFGRAQGLPADQLLTNAPVAVYGLATNDNGLVWAAAANGVYLLATPTTWLYDGLAGDVRTLAVVNNNLIAGKADGQGLRLDRTTIPGLAPTAQLTINGAAVLTTRDTLSLTGNGHDPDGDNRILAWDWSSDLDGPLCTAAGECTLPAAQLTPGVHLITLRVQDDEGVWSLPVTITVTIVEATALYLPLVAAK